MVERWHNSRASEPDCPRCIELRGKAVKMSTVAKGPSAQKNETQTTVIVTAYECPSCDYVIVLQPFEEGRS